MDLRVQSIVDELGLKDVQYLGSELKKWELLFSSDVKTPQKALIVATIVNKIKELIVLKALEISSYSSPSMALSFSDSEKMLSQLHTVSSEEAREYLEKYDGDIMKASEALDSKLLKDEDDFVGVKSIVYDIPLAVEDVKESREEEEDEDDTTENGEVLSEEAANAMLLRYGESMKSMLHGITKKGSSDFLTSDDKFEDEFQAFINETNPKLRSPVKEIQLIEN
jgi:hypothetical protein